MKVSTVFPPENQSKRLHLDPKISWGHILTTVALIGSVLVAWGDTNERLSSVESENAHQRELIDMQQARTAESRIELNNIVNNINGKLDRLIERQSSRANVR